MRPAMIVVLVAVTALIAIAVVAALRMRADRPPSLGVDPPGATSMTRYDVLRGWRLKSQRLPVDDAYTTWFNANRRCGEALRAWLEAAPEARPDAYRAYLAELELEETAAAELELHAVALAA
jgi:hypothetical protein